MSLRIVLVAPYPDGDDDPSAVAKDPRPFEVIVGEHLAAAPVQVGSPRFAESDHGIGASWPTLMIEIATLGGTIFFGIPAARKRLREAIDGWKQLKSDLDKLVSWIRKRHSIVSLSREAAFLCVLERLEQNGFDPGEFDLVSVTEVPGPGDCEGADFENAPDLLYVFILRSPDTAWAHMFVVTNGLELVHEHRLRLSEHA